ncbi:MAG: RNA-binding protein [Lachnospiraceae bacterium]|jgi:RNA-binding protein YlmH
MTREEQILCGHLLDLARICGNSGRPVSSGFLSLAEQDLFLTVCVPKLPGVQWRLDGGTENAERKAVCYTAQGAGRDECPAPCVLLKAEQTNPRFAEKLTHRDYLGALMNLGLERSVIGDLLPVENGCYIICLEHAADFICGQYSLVRHTAVRCARVPWTDFQYTPATKEIRGTVSSVRLDSLIAIAFRESRSRMAPLIAGEKVYVNGKCVRSASYLPHPGDLISVRGKGKFRYAESGGVTKKGRVSVLIERFV